jgi:hypothetical protein
MWVQILLNEFGIQYPRVRGVSNGGFMGALTQLWCDNIGATYHSAKSFLTGHVKVDYHFVREIFCMKAIGHQTYFSRTTRELRIIVLSLFPEVPKLHMGLRNLLQ